MEKLKMHSRDNVAANVEAVGRLFPNALTEVMRDGKVVQAIDFDVLRQELAREIVEGREERYAFTWPDKQQAILAANAPIAMALRPVVEDSVGRDGTAGSFDSENLYIEGDNLDVLKLLQETYLGKVKMIYIDKSITRLIHSRDRGKGLKSPIFGGFSFCWDKAVEMKFGVGEETSSSYAHTLKR